MNHQQANSLDRFRNTLDYELANAEMDFTDALEDLMRRRNVNKSELARRIETSPAYITKILRGSTNFTLETMVKLVRAVEGRLHVRVCGTEDDVRWFGLPNVTAQRAARSQAYAEKRFRDDRYYRYDRATTDEERSDELTAAA
jgi:transcriptional regulator with XRE-family HTH domain